jgi:hypothetical protein
MGVIAVIAALPLPPWHGDLTGCSKRMIVLKHPEDFIKTTSCDTAIFATRFVHC